MTKKRQIMIYKTLHSNLKIEQTGTLLKSGDEPQKGKQLPLHQWEPRYKEWCDISI